MYIQMFTTMTTSNDDIVDHFAKQDILDYDDTISSESKNQKIIQCTLLKYRRNSNQLRNYFEQNRHEGCGWPHVL